MAVQGFFSPDRKTRMAGEKENNSTFSVKVEPVRVANNINQYNEQTPSLDYAPDRVGDYIRESETKSYTPKEDTGYGASLEKSIDNLDRFDRRFYNIDKATKEYGVPMSKEEKRVTTAYTLTNPDNFGSSSYKFSDTDYDKIQSDYAKYKDLRDRRDFRREAEETVNKFRSDAMADYQRADYAIKMTQYNPDGTEKDINKYNRTLDQQVADLKRVNRTNEDLVDMSKRYPGYYKENFSDEGLYGLSRFGKVIPQSEINAYEKKVAAEEAERTRLSKLKAKTDYEESQKNIFQKVGDAFGNVFNTLTGTLPAGAQGINTSATVNIAQMGNVDPVTQASRDIVARSNLRRSGLDKTIGGQSSQANYGRASKGFGTGTHGKGMPSNPGSQRQTGVGVSASNLSRHKAGSSVGRRGTTGSKSTSRGTAGSRSRGGTGTGRSSQGSKSSARGARGGTSSRSRGGTGAGQSRSGGTTGRKASKASRSRTGRSRSQCDIRTKIDISPLINSNLVKDNLAEVAYFVQEIKK